MNSTDLKEALSKIIDIHDKTVAKIPDLLEAKKEVTKLRCEINSATADMHSLYHKLMGGDFE